MYQIIHMDNCTNRDTYDIYKKEIETKEEAEIRYAEIFALVKECIIEELKLIITANPEMAPVLQQIISVVSELEENEEIELTARDETFLTAGTGYIEFKFLSRHIILKLED